MILKSTVRRPGSLNTLTIVSTKKTVLFQHDIFLVNSGDVETKLKCFGIYTRHSLIGQSLSKTRDIRIVKAHTTRMRPFPITVPLYHLLNHRQNVIRVSIDTAYSFATEFWANVVEGTSSPVHKSKFVVDEIAEKFAAVKVAF